MGSYESGIPLSSPTYSGITTDTLFLAELTADFSPDICFDLGTGTGEILRNAGFQNSFLIGIDISLELLEHFDKAIGQPVLCSVENINRTFRANCADLVLANPPYFDKSTSRKSPDLFRQQARTGDSLLLYRFIFAAAYLLRKGGNLLLSGRSSDKDKIEQGLRAADFGLFKSKERGKIIVIQSTLLF